MYVGTLSTSIGGKVKQVTIVVPTYNEEGNIPYLIERIDKTLMPFKSIGYAYDIQFVDDNSQDKTVEVIHHCAKAYPVAVSVRLKERGLATAVLQGIRLAKGLIIGVMDADLQHPPEVLNRLLVSIDNGADLAVASRYVYGGGCPEWSMLRKIISRGAMKIAHTCLPETRHIHDPMSGFFMFRREYVDGVKFEPIGYKILLEMLVMCKFRHVSEVPFVFEDRSSGRSKMKVRQQLDYLRHVHSLIHRSVR